MEENAKISDARIAELEGALKKEIESVEADERYHYDPASYQINGPLALIQVDLKARHRLASRLLDFLTSTDQEEGDE
jgi:hypothetical protein